MSGLVPSCSRDGDLPPAYRRLAVPTERLSSPEAAARGRRLYEKTCALCHGMRGDGHGPRREGLSKPPRDFTSVAWRSSASPRRVFFAIREGLHGTPMPAWRDLDDGEAWDLAAYVLSLSSPKGTP